MTITVLPTGGRMTTLETNVTTLGELKELLQSNGVPTDNNTFIVGETKTELISNSSILPTTNFKLFVYPKATKSGIGRDEVVSTIKAIRKDLKSLVIRIEHEGVTDFNSSNLFSNEDMSDAERELREEAEALKKEFENNL
jgi:hypothetical protein